MWSCPVVSSFAVLRSLRRGRSTRSAYVRLPFRPTGAWSNYLAVASATKLAGQTDREQVARERAAALEPRLSKLRIDVPERLEQLRIKRNGVDVAEAQWASEVPVDPGEYRVEASAPQRQPWAITVAVRGEGRTITVTVPSLTEISAAEPPPVNAKTNPQPPPSSPAGPAPEAPADPWPQRIVALAAGGLGLAGIGIGTAYGIIAISKNEDSQALCDADGACEDEGITLNEDARTAGTISTGAFIAGGALLALGVVLWVTAPSDDATSAGRTRLWLGAFPGGARIGVRF